MEGRKVSILLVEDDEVDILSIKRAFHKNNLINRVFIAHNGLEALTLLRETNGSQWVIPRPLIVVLDINLPKMNGLEFLKELRADSNFKATTVIVLTTSNEQRDIKAAYNYNVAGYILKPLEGENFNEAFESVYKYWSLNQLPE